MMRVGGKAHLESALVAATNAVSFENLVVSYPPASSIAAPADSGMRHKSVGRRAVPEAGSLELA